MKKNEKTYAFIDADIKKNMFDITTVQKSARKNTHSN